MIVGTFDIAVDTPKLHRRGTLVLKSAGETIAGRLTAGDSFVIERVGTCADKDFAFEGEADIPSMGQVGFVAKGNVWGNSVTMTCETDMGKIEIFGTRLSASVGDFGSSHDFIMQASTGNGVEGQDAYFSGRYSDGA